MRDLLVELLGRPHGIVVHQLLDATQYTIYLSLIAFAGGGLIGAVLAILRVVPSPAAQRIATVYVWLFQSTPLLMLLFLTGLGVPRLFGAPVNPWLAAIVSLTLYASAYMADVWRGAIEAVPRGQWEAGSALGLRFLPVLTLVVVPQAIPIALAPTVGFMVQIIKGTSLAYIIGFTDLMTIGRRWANAPVPGTEPFIVFPLLALIYFSLCFPLSVLSRRLERRFGTSRGTNLAASA